MLMNLLTDAVAEVYTSRNTPVQTVAYVFLFISLHETIHNVPGGLTHLHALLRFPVKPD
jgi:hypothetical protein